MIGRLFSFLAVLGVAAAQNQCTSLASLVHVTTGAPSGLAIPDCSYIQANSATICNSLGAWDIINANTCYLKGPGYGCTIVNGQFSTPETFYCQVGPAATSTSTFSPLATLTPSASASGSPSVSQEATLTSTPSGSPSVSQEATLTPTPSGSASAFPSLSPKSTPSGSASAQATATSTLTSTPSTTLSMNQTIVLVYTTVKDTSIDTGQAAAIGLSAIFGFCLLAACGHMMRKRPTEEIIKRTVTVIERYHTKVAERPPSQVAERRPSQVAERRPSQVAERRPSQIAEPTTPKVIIRTVV